MRGLKLDLHLLVVLPHVQKFSFETPLLSLAFFTPLLSLLFCPFSPFLPIAEIMSGAAESLRRIIRLLRDGQRGVRGGRAALARRRRCLPPLCGTTHHRHRAP